MSHASDFNPRTGSGAGFVTSAATVYDVVNRDSIEDLLEVLDDLSTILPEQDHPLSSFINYVHPQTGQTSLHLSARQLNTDILRLLLVHGANPNAQDVKGQTSVLHVLNHLQDVCICDDCKRKAVKCINILGEYNADMNLRDSAGDRSPLAMSALLGLQQCATALLNHGAIASTMLSTTDPKSKSLIALLLERIPEVVLTVFDRAIEITPSPGASTSAASTAAFACQRQRQLPSDKSFELTFDMSTIIPPHMYASDDYDRGGSSANAKSQPQTNGIEKSFKKIQKAKIRPRREMGFLSQLLDSSMLQDVQVYNAILQHPMVHLFADIKWNRLKFIYFIYMMMQANILVWYTVFLILVIYVDCHLKEVADTILNANSSATATTTTGTTRTTTTNIGLGPSQINDPFSCHYQLVTKLVGGYVFCMTMGSTTKEMMYMVMDFRNYVRDIINFIQLGGIVTTLSTVVIVLNPVQLKLLHVWLYPLASFGIGVCWLQMFLIIGRLPELAMYLEMLSKVTINFAWSLGMYSFILIAFATSYCMVFPIDSKLSDFPWALVRIMTAMVGELNFETLFEDKSKVINPWLALGWYACLLILVSLVLMNLMVGLAVSDIQGCKRNAEIVVIQRRIRYLVYLEKSFFLGTMAVPSCLRDFLRKRIALVVPYDAQIGLHWLTHSSSIPAGLKVTIRPNDPRGGIRLTTSTKDAIKYWLKRTGAQRSQHNDPQGHVCPPPHGKSTLLVKPKPVKKLTTQSHAQDSEDKDRHMHMRKMEYKMQQLESKLSELDNKLDRYFERILFIKQSNE